MKQSFEESDVVVVRRENAFAIMKVSGFVDHLDSTKPLWCHPRTPSGQRWSKREVQVQPEQIIGLVYESEEEGEEVTAEEMYLRATCLRVKATPCQRCLFSRRAWVPPDRVEEYIRANVENGTIFSCHEASWQGQKICCHAYWKKFEHTLPAFIEVKLLQAAGWPDAIRFVEPGPDVRALNNNHISKKG